MKLRISHLALLCLLSLSLLPARADDDTYNPIAVGLRWLADVTMTTPDGRTVQGKAIREITGTEVINGKTYFTSVSKVDGIPLFKPFTTYRRKTAEGVFAISASDPKKLEYLETALPLAVGKTWEVSSDKGRMFFTVEAQEAVTVGKVKYEKCFKLAYRAEGTPFSGHFHLAPNVGNVTETMKVGAATLIFTNQSFTTPK